MSMGMVTTVELVFRQTDLLLFSHAQPFASHRNVGRSLTGTACEDATAHVCKTLKAFSIIAVLSGDPFPPPPTADKVHRRPEHLFNCGLVSRMPKMAVIIRCCMHGGAFPRPPAPPPTSAAERRWQSDSQSLRDVGSPVTRASPVTPQPLTSRPSCRTVPACRLQGLLRRWR